MAKYNMEIAGDDLIALFRPRVAALAAKAVLTGYSLKKGESIFELGSALNKLAKRGDTNLKPDHRIALGYIIAEAARASGALVVVGDTINLRIVPPKNVGSTVSPQVRLTLGAGNVGDDGVLPGSHATVEVPWVRTPAKYENLPVELDLTAPPDESWIGVFNKK